MLAMLAARNYTLLTHQKIAEYFSGITFRSLSQILKRCRQLISSNHQIRKQYDEIKKQIEMLFAVDPCPPQRSIRCWYVSSGAQKIAVF
jgi:hypothetical protein